jgi:four helix bundle protein
MRDYRQINACRLADDLALEIYRITSDFPNEERDGLTSQLRRAAASAPAYIAEGSAHERKQDCLRLLYLARGSLAQILYLIHLASRLGLIAMERSRDLEEQTRRIYGCLHGLIQAIEGESGLIGRIVAAGARLVTLCAARLSSRSSSVVLRH